MTAMAMYFPVVGPRLEEKSGCSVGESIGQFVGDGGHRLATSETSPTAPWLASHHPYQGNAVKKKYCNGESFREGHRQPFTRSQVRSNERAPSG